MRVELRFATEPDTIEALDHIEGLGFPVDRVAREHPTDRRVKPYVVVFTIPEEAVVDPAR